MASSKTKSKKKSSLDRILTLLEDELFSFESRDDTFNFYRDADPAVDLPDAPEIRRRNLEGYLEQVADPPTVLVVGDAPVWRGTRFTGIPFTSQAQLLRPDFPVEGDRSSRGPNPLSERTATQLWETFLPHHPRIFLWNAYPIHSHRKGASRTNRTPSRRELQEFGELLRALREILDPELVLAVGRTAQTALSDVEVEHTYVRHPAYGGLRSFRRGVSDALEDDDD